MAELRLQKGHVALIDDEDVERVTAHRWHAIYDGYNWYARCEGPRKPDGTRTHIHLHRFVMGEPPDKVDHKNRNGLDCRKLNLRVATDAQNTWNRGPHRGSESGLKGVCRNSNGGKWCAYIYLKGKRLHLGSFPSPTEAAKAYDLKAADLFGDFAYLNFPPEVAQ